MQVIENKSEGGFVVLARAFCGALSVVLSACMAAVACWTVEIERPPDAEDWGVGDTAGTPALPPEPEEVVKKDIYVTGVKYRDGYDWHADSDYGHALCTLFLMRGTERILSLPVGAEHLMSPDADMHRCFGGHLYTDFSTDHETVIKKDGVELFRYQAREMICGFHVEKGEVHTLGMARDGSGWTYRKNGVVVLGGDAGHLKTGFGTDGRVLWFAYAEYGNAVLSQDEGAVAKAGGGRYFVVRNGVPEEIRLQRNVSSVDDLVLHGGEVSYVACLGGAGAHAVFTGASSAFLELGGMSQTKDCRFRCGEDSPMQVSGLRYGVSGTACATVWTDCAVTFEYPDAEICWCGVEDGQLNMVLKDISEAEPRLVIVDGAAAVDYGREHEYSFLSEAGACADAGRLYVALYPKEQGTHPAMMYDGVFTEYDFNGYFTSVTAW